MKTLRAFVYVMLLGLPLLFNQCQPTGSELVPTKTSRTAGARDGSSCAGTGATSASVGNYSITYKGVSQVGDNWVWEYEVSKTGNGGGPLYLSMGCVTKDDYAYINVGGDDLPQSPNGYTHGKSCADVEGSFLKLAGLNGDFNGQNETGTVTVKIALKVNVDPTAGTVSSIATGACGLQPLVTPGCYHVCGKILQNQCAGLGDPTPVAGQLVSLSNGMTTTTDADGTYCFCGVNPGSYTLTVAGQTKEVTVSPSSVDNVTINLEAICAGCSFSQGFYFRSQVGVAYSASKYDLMVGGKPYTQAQAIAIFNGRSGGSANISNIFTQCATIKLSVLLGSTGLVAPLDGYVKTIEDYLGGIPKLDGSSLPVNSKIPKMSGGVTSAAAVTAAGNISAWIEANHCTELP
jgi:hypothetical protein